MEGGRPTEDDVTTSRVPGRLSRAAATLTRINAQLSFLHDRFVKDECQPARFMKKSPTLLVTVSVYYAAMKLFPSAVQ